ncbi:hypothetical protein [Nocardia bovistercoris]|uniref:SprT-like domain-containing protein n=1 Tax=Nocardia bovistercoris TaxID=2785916 RepID=A0A931I551_9NOCA|nr:hypothetical protein [Nocardia bovistercoris]MBH0775049.1 hypothetical protein [Nocardia bovistercoris]
MSRFAGTVVVAIEQAWAAIRAAHPDVPDVVVTMASGSAGSPRALRLGHFGPDRWVRGTDWMPELFVGGEGFAFGARDVFGTLLHEAAHGIARTRDIQDVSRGGAYHNGRYRKIAEELGLAVARDGHRGWTDTTVPDEVAARYRRQIDALSKVLIAHRRNEHDPAPGTPKGTAAPEGEGQDRAPRNGRALVCGCDPVRRVRAAQRTIEAGPILCGVCGQAFAVVEAEAA